MDEVIFCSFCRSMLSKEYYYCPFCGTPCRDSSALEDQLDESFERLEAVSTTTVFDRLHSLQSALTELEQELDEFLSAHTPL
jgi:hypothetical protein